MDAIRFPPPPRSDRAEALRREVRAFLAEALADMPPRRRIESWMGFDPAFSRKLGERGWIGMTWPKAYGGEARSAAERYVVLEELLAVGAPVAAHWIAARQSGPLILAHGSEAQKSRLLPLIAAGELYVCIGMSEPDAGSDLASVRTRAEPTADGYRVNGTKLWTTNAHRSHFMILLCRTGPGTGREGLSQLLVDLATPGIRINPIEDMAGQRHFNEVVFEDVLLAPTALIGEEGRGWAQAMAELSLERSGPERFLSTYPLLAELVHILGGQPSEAAAAAVGRLAAHLVTLRHLSRSVAAMIDEGEDPALQAALVKDLGASFEQEIAEVARSVAAVEPSMAASSEFSAALAYALLSAPSFSLRGGTREILRGIIARGLGLR